MQKVKYKNKMYMPTCLLRIPRHDMNLREVMQTQVIFKEAIYYPGHGEIGEHVNLAGTKKLLDDGK